MKLAIWAPHLKFFVTYRDGSLVLFDQENEDWAKTFAEQQSPKPCLQHSIMSCKQCAFRVVKWDKQAQDIANGTVLP